MLFATKHLIRRYTPPTCTLELWNQRSRLKPFLKSDQPQDWQFELRFDDPRMPEEQQLTLQGDRLQLDQLCEGVGNYLQKFLQETRGFLTGSTTEPRERSFGNSGRVSLVEIPERLPNQPFLRSQGQLSHELHGGALAGTASPAIATLSTSQLFDLSHALDDYQRDRAQLLNPKPFSVQPKSWLLPIGIAIALGGLGWIWGQEQWRREFASPAFNAAQNTPSPHPSPPLNAVPPVPLPPTLPIPSPSLAPTLANRDPLPLPPPATPGDPLARSTFNEIQVSGLRVLPPVPLAPPAPPLPSGATSTVGLNPLDPGILNIPPVPPANNNSISPLKRLPLPPPLFASRGNSTYSAIASRSPSASEAASEAAAENGLEANSIAHSSPPIQTRLLDTIPQVTEVRTYFQKSWQKPPDLKQTLEYRLSLKPDGSLAKIVPLGKAALIYQPQVGMPALGQVFVSPLRQPEDQTIRLVLDLEGKVSTFLE